MPFIIRLVGAVAGFIIFIAIIWFFTLVGLGVLLVLTVLTLIFRSKMKTQYIHIRSRQSRKEKNHGPILEHDEFKQD